MKSAGAVSTFFGTTRDTFEGKEVTHLEYEAYPEMALASMLDICAKVDNHLIVLIGNQIKHGSSFVGKRAMVPAYGGDAA